MVWSKVNRGACEYLARPRAPLFVADCESEDGWVWATDHTEVLLCGAACQEFKALQAIEIEFYCSPG